MEKHHRARPRRALPSDSGELLNKLLCACKAGLQMGWGGCSWPHAWGCPTCWGDRGGQGWLCTDADGAAGLEPLGTLPLSQEHHSSLFSALFRQILPAQSPWLRNPLCRAAGGWFKRPGFNPLSRLFLLPRPSVLERSGGSGLLPGGEGSWLFLPPAPPC